MLPEATAGQHVSRAQSSPRVVSPLRQGAGQIVTRHREWVPEQRVGGAGVRTSGPGDPRNATAAVEYRFGLMRAITVNLRAEDIFRSSNSRPSWADNPASLLYVPGTRPDPSTNVLNLRGIVHWPDFDLALFVNNALDLGPTLGQIGDPPSGLATTLRPRTVGISATRRF